MKFYQLTPTRQVELQKKAEAPIVRQNYKRNQNLKPTELMKATKSKILAGVVTLALANSPSSLQAQSSLPAYYDAPYSGTSTGTMPGRYYATPLSGKLYLGFDAGAAWQQDITISDSVGDSDRVTFGTGARLDCEPGYNFTKNWAAELEVGLIINPVAHSYVLGTDFMSVDFTELPVMVNVIYTRPLGHHFSAYVGGGVGGVFSDYSNEFGDTTPSDSAFAFQGMAGVKYAINERWDIGVAYKFLGTTGHDVGPGVAYDLSTPTEYKSDGTMTHSFLVALTCKF
jgi:opacity protein-like surface antigen